MLQKLPLVYLYENLDVLRNSYKEMLTTNNNIAITIVVGSRTRPERLRVLFRTSPLNYSKESLKSKNSAPTVSFEFIHGFEVLSGTTVLVL